MPDTDPLASRRSEPITRLFTWYLRFYLRRNFNALRISRSGLPQLAPGRPVIVCTNHPSWWDPAVFILLMAALFPGRRGYGPMDAAALGRYGVLQRVGIFGIAPDARGAVRFLRIGRAVLAARHMLWITAEGHFTDPRCRPVRLRPGIAHLAHRAEGAVILPLALDYLFWNERFPEALVHFGAPIEAGPHLTTAAWTARLEQALAEAMDALATASRSRNPALFHTLLGGRRGIGGVYDLYRRGRAWWAGRPFQPGHEAGGP